MEADVRFSACRMTVDLFGYRREELIDGIEQWVVATSFRPEATKADVTLFI
ncbi:DsrE/DsrF/DrsH-like family protein [Endothiovibrio diazotrophicus]